MTDMKPWQSWLYNRGIDDSSIRRFRLDGDGDRIVIPYFDAMGEYRTARWRKMDPDAKPKYLSERGSGTHLYNIGALPASPIYLTEGEFDTIILEQNGRPSVGVPGAELFQEVWRWLFVDLEVRICFDGDEAGQRGAMKIAKMLNPVAAEVTIVEMPEGEDVSSMNLLGRLQEVLDQ